MLPLKKKLELNSVMSFWTKFRNRLFGLNHVVFSEKIESGSA